MKADISGFKLHDILLLIGLEGRTGELTLESGNNIGSLLFHDGKILLAFSPYTRAIGDLLVEQGVLTDAELLDVLKQQMTGPHTPVGTLLLKTGKVTFSIIETMVQEQIRNAVQDFSMWSPLDFNFAKKDIKPFDSINLPVYEFIPQEFVKSSLVFAAGMANVVKPAAAEPSPASRH
ncbi:MAG: DUF4388 domain-containing protein [Nitrospirota bacterium]